MMTTIDHIFHSRLNQREDLCDPQRRVWEHKAAMVHRGVLHWRPTEPSLTCAEMIKAARKDVKAIFRPSTWRGFGFGVLIESPAIPNDLPEIDSAINAWSINEGTWQWIIFACEPLRAAAGIHAWIEGYLSPIYRALMEHYLALGFETRSFVKPQKPLLRVLNALAGVSFPSFKDQS